MKRFFSRHPALWRLMLSVLAIFVSAFLVLSILDWPSLTQAGAVARLARENGVEAAPILRVESAECQMLEGYDSDRSHSAWTLGYDGAQYQLAQLEHCVMNLLWKPWYYPNTLGRDPLSFQIVTPSEDIPLQYRLVLAREGKSNEYDFPGSHTEYLALLFASPSIVRVEARQQTTENNADADWAADPGMPISATRFMDGVWQVRYTQHRNNDQMQHTRFVGYDANGNPYEAVYAPTPPFA